ncbi:MAG: PEP-CTERM sorting domain-containing protein [Verrucomicrobiota bacterium]
MTIALADQSTPTSMNHPQRMNNTLAVLFFAALSVSQGWSASVAITNHNFEIGGLGDNQNSAFPGVIPTGWSVAPGGTSGDFFGYYNPVNEAGGYQNVSSSPGTTGTMDGPNVFYFGSFVDGQGIQQTLVEKFALNTDYTLTVARGTRNSIYNNTLRMQLLAGTTVLATRDVAPGTPGTFEDYSTSYLFADGANNTVNAALVGQDLTIRFLEVGANFEVDIDNVRLSAVPEPATSLLLALGAVCALRRRRN